MTPRATVQQAIEFLKIHQIRRENAAICRQLQTLQDEISELYDKKDDMFEQLDVLRSNLSKTSLTSDHTQKEIGHIQRSIESLEKDARSLQITVANTKGHCNEDHKTAMSESSHLRYQIESLEARLKDLSEQQSLQHIAWQNEAKDLRFALKHNDKKHPLQISTRLETIEKDLLHLQAESRSMNSVSRVNDSLEEINTAMNNNAEIQNVSNTKSCDRPIIVADRSSEPTVTLQMESSRRTSTVPDDLNLDENATVAGRAHYPQKSVISAGSPTALASVHENNQVYTNQILALERGSAEPLTSYLKRGLAVVENLPNDCEARVLRHLVRELAKKNDQSSFVGRPSQNGDCKDYAQGNSCVRGVGEPRLSSCAKLDPKDNDNTAEFVPTVDVLVRATESSDRDSQAAKCKTTKHKGCSLNSGRRRSLRLAAKLGAQVRDIDGKIPSEPPEKKQQSNALDTSNIRNVGAGSMKRKRDKEESERIENVVVKTVKTSNDKQHAHADHSQSSMRVLGAYRVASAGTERGLPACFLQAPNKIIQRETLESGVRSEAEPVPRRVYSGQKAAQIGDVRTASRELRKFMPSPYRPQPRLVAEQRGKVATQAEPTSDPDLLLPYTKDKAKTASAGRGPRQARKKERKLPLPPPPEIPILSTSTEHDHRFDRW